MSKKAMSMTICIPDWELVQLYICLSHIEGHFLFKMVQIKILGFITVFAIWQKNSWPFLYFSNFFKKKNDPLCNVHCSWAYLEPKKERNSLAWIWDSCRKKNQIDRRRNEEIHTNTQKKYSSLGCVLLLRRRVVALCSKIQEKIASLLMEFFIRQGL